MTQSIFQMVSKKHDINITSELCRPSANEYSEQQRLFEVEQTTQLLLSIHVDLSYDAVNAASTLAQADVNLAMYAIEQALSAPPVCRHMLYDGCYRSDCHFSHDVDSHTCSFWMRGRCGKGASCRFLHGFAKCLIEGVRAPRKDMEQVNRVPVLSTVGA